MPSNPRFPNEDHAILEDAFGPNMKYAGYDQIIVRGRSKTPVYVFIDDERIEFRGAKHLWGEKTKKAAIRIQEELASPDLDLAIIGPAGEARLPFANLHSIIRPAIGGPGLGAVMGEKKLKALVIRGKRPIRIADPKKFTAACWTAREKLDGAGRTENADSTGPLKSKPVTCWACPLGCGQYAAIQEGVFDGFHGSGPQDEAVHDADPRIAGADDAGRFLLYETAQDLGMDGAAAMDVIASLMDLSEKEEIGGKQTKGISLQWGDVEKAVSVLERIARRRFPAPLLKKCLLHNAGEKIVGPCRGLDKAVPAGIETMRCIADAVGGCSHAAGFPNIRHLWLDVYAPLFKYATGVHFSEVEIRRAAHRILNAEKAARTRTGV
jgi:aldehyde:ferredoxin oxidoreductase